MLTRAFRLFVSSTFQDFREERRLLQDEVFPGLEVYCAGRGFDFRAVDMRWGVNEYAQLEQRTAEICLGEVEAASGHPPPNLLILVGDRYGWIPLPFAIARDELEAARDWLRQGGKDDLIADLDRVYQLDENHLVAPGLRRSDGTRPLAAYTLRSRHGELADLETPDAWAAVEARLRDGLQAAARCFHEARQIDDAGRDKYFISLTEQEIREGLEAGMRALAWVRTTDAGEPQARALADQVRRALPAADVAPAEAPPPEAYRNVFVATIKAKLTATIDDHIARVSAIGQDPDFALHTERMVHEAFAAERLRVFVGRDSNRAAIRAYIAGDARHPLVLTGTSGSGKTALMARAAADAAQAAPGKLVARFVGASAASADQRALLLSVMDDLVALGAAQKPEPWEDDDNRFVNQVRDLIATIEQPVVVFVDALDQLRAPYRQAWLPLALAGGVKLVVSALDDEAFPAERGIVEGLRRSLPAEAFLAIEPLREKDGRDILAGLERDVQRALRPAQRNFILERFHDVGASPLYLRVAFAIASRWRSTDDPRARGLAGNVTSLIGQFIDELSTVHHHEPKLVRHALGLIAAGKDGLSESELIAVLSRDRAVMEAAASERFGARTARLPDSVWVRLRRDLDALLVETGVDGEPLMQFFHRQVAELVRTRFYEPEQVALHTALAAFFDAPVEGANAESTFSRRSFSELTFQLFHAGPQSRARLAALLTDPAWIDGKITAFGGVAEIVSDYHSFAEPAQSLATLVGHTLRLSAGTITHDLRQAMPQLHGRLIGAVEGDEAAFLQSLFNRIPDGSLIETRTALAPPGQELARLAGYGGSVQALAVLPDGSLASGSWGIRLWDPANGRELARLEGHTDPVTALAVLPDGRLASGSGGGDDDDDDDDPAAIRLWDPTSRRELARLAVDNWVWALAVLPNGCIASGLGSGSIGLWDPASGHELASLEGHTNSVKALAVLPDGRLASGSNDRSIRLWDPESGRELARLEGHASSIQALAVLSDGRLVSAADDIRLWDPAIGREVARLEGHTDALAVLPDGRLVSGSDDDSIRLWDPTSGQELARFEGHTGSVKALAVLPDGRLASASTDGTIRLWNPATGLEPRRPEDRIARVNALAVLPDGRLASGTEEGSIGLWDPASGRELARLEGDTSSVTALVVLPDGRVASGAGNGSIRLWDPAIGQEAARLEGHTGSIDALAVLPDGRLASAANDRSIRLWDPASGRELSRQEGDTHVLAVLPDGRLASGNSRFKDGDHSIWLWDPAIGSKAVRLEGGIRPVNALAVLPDGRLASAERNVLSISLWDPASGRELARLQGLSGGVNALAVLPDGRLASGSNDRSIRLWDPVSGRETARLDVDGRVLALAALPDGRLAASDELGRIHWLAIKGAAPTGRALPRAIAPPPKPAPGAAPASSESDPAASPPRKRRARFGLATTVAALALIAALAAAAGPQLGFSAVHDVLARLFQR